MSRFLVISTWFAALFLPCLSSAQPASKRAGTIIVAHGGDAGWNAHVRQVAREVELRGPVAVSFLMGPEAATTRFQDLAERMEASGIDELVVVPLLVSSHSEHYEQVRYLAGLTDSVNEALHAHMGHSGLAPAQLRVKVRVARALDDAPVLAQILAERAVALAGDRPRQALFLVGHGPNSAEDHAHWMKNLRAVADSVRVRARFADVRVELLRDDAPAHVRAEAVRRVRELISMQHAITRDTVVVVPVLLSRGRVSRQTFLADLSGLPVLYSGDPLLPHVGLARWVEARVAEAMSTGGARSP